MQFETLYFRPKLGWDKEFPSLDSEKTLVLVFGVSEEAEFTHAFEQLQTQYPSAQFIGCSSAGEIIGEQEHDESLVATVVKFNSTTLRTAQTELNAMTSSYQAGCQLAEALRGEGLKHVFVLGDGLQTQGSELVSALSAELGPDVTITGGLAGDNMKFAKTLTCAQTQMGTSTISAVGFYGDKLQVHFGCSAGWDRFGPERIITKSEGNILFELDGRPALDVYNAYLGEYAKDEHINGFHFPFGIRPGADGSEQIVRTVMEVNEADKSLRFAGDVPLGWTAQLLYANSDRLLLSAENTAADAVCGEEPVLAISVSCVGRRVALGARAEEELEAVFSVLPKGSALAGYYSYGEIAPDKSGKTCLHNETMTLTTFREAA